MTTQNPAYVAARDLMGECRPGSYGDDWTWRDEARDLLRRQPLAMLRLAWSIRQHGMQKSVSLGDDGRVWDGHHRIIAAWIARRPVRVLDWRRSDTPTLHAAEQGWVTDYYWWTGEDLDLPGGGR